MKKRTVLILSGVILLISACTPEQMALNDKLNAFQPGHTARMASNTEYQCAGSQYGYLIDRYFEPHDRATACRVMVCESHGHGQDPVTINNMSGSSASGLFQFLDGTWNNAKKLIARAAPYSRAAHAPADIQVQVAAAWEYHTSWNQWACY